MVKTTVRVREQSELRFYYKYSLKAILIPELLNLKKRYHLVALLDPSKGTNSECLKILKTSTARHAQALFGFDNHPNRSTALRTSPSVMFRCKGSPPCLLYRCCCSCSSSPKPNCWHHLSNSRAANATRIPFLKASKSFQNPLLPSSDDLKR